MFHHPFRVSEDTAFFLSFFLPVTYQLCISLCLSLCHWPGAQSSRMCVTLPFASDILTLSSGFLVQEISCARELSVSFDSKTQAVYSHNRTQSHC